MALVGRTHTPTLCVCLGLYFVVLPAMSPTLSGQYSKLGCASCKVWNQPQEPFRIFGNTYYVGTHGLSSILITSPAGHVLIDGALAESVEQIRDHIRTLGFRLEDVKLILNSHVHFDHAGGIAALQHWSHARVVASSWSAEVLRKGGVGRDDPQYGLLPGIAKARHVEHFSDHDVLHVGDTAIEAHLTPGHTPGGTSWTWKSCEGEHCLALVYADSMNAISAPNFKFSDHPDVVKSFEKSFAFFEMAPCDILLTVHPETGDLWNRLERRHHGIKPDPMIDDSACRNLADAGRNQLAKRLQAEVSH